ncbi:MAG TPA: hypothetical protein VND93_28915, partial [Myxococcales bacterium]|nr:hypothetical protein [Myxococcales bacterium]
KQIGTRLNQLKKQKKSHDELKENVFERLKQTEDEQWDFLVDLGAEVANAKAAGSTIKKEWVTYGTKKDPSKYSWGSLF